MEERREKKTKERRKRRLRRAERKRGGMEGRRGGKEKKSEALRSSSLGRKANVFRKARTKRKMAAFHGGETCCQSLRSSLPAAPPSKLPPRLLIHSPPSSSPQPPLLRSRPTLFKFSSVTAPRMDRATRNSPHLPYGFRNKIVPT